MNGRSSTPTSSSSAPLLDAPHPTSSPSPASSTPSSSLPLRTTTSPAAPPTHEPSARVSSAQVSQASQASSAQVSSARRPSGHEPSQRPLSAHEPPTHEPPTHPLSEHEGHDAHDPHEPPGRLPPAPESSAYGLPELQPPVHQLSPSLTARKAAAVRAAAAEGLITDDSPVVGFIDLDAIAVSQAELKQAFAFTSAPVLHAFAAKAASLVPLLRLFADAGMGCEVASPGELAQALAAGFPPERVVLDSPAKTPSELRDALRLGIAVNADNFTELERIDRLLRELDLLDAHGHAPALGLRINPQVGAGTIEAMSTASARSKFGVPLRDRGGREAIIAAFDRYPWLTRLHVHVGSQGCPLELIAAGIRSVYELAEEINARAAADPDSPFVVASSPGTDPESPLPVVNDSGADTDKDTDTASAPGRHRGRRVTSIDIGGGLPVNFDDDRVSPTFAEYAEVLRDAVPGLFDGRYGLVTEFGRSLSAKNGFTLARVEYAKQVADRRIALTHAGAQVATRTVFMPEAWPLRLSAYRSDGWPKLGPVCTHDIAGPCCFAGDLVATGRDLEVLDTGDLILLHDTGGYFFTAPWAYNSLPRPDVYGFRVEADGKVRFTLMRRRQTLEEIVAEAGGDPASVNSLTSEHSLG